MIGTAAIKQDKCVDVCYINFSRAFDSVSLPKFSLKLVAYDILNEISKCVKYCKLKLYAGDVNFILMHK
jgi:hypothetical protein